MYHHIIKLTFRFNETLLSLGGLIMADIEKMQAELQRLQEKQAVLKARQERQQARLNAEKKSNETNV